MIGLRRNKKPRKLDVETVSREFMPAAIELEQTPANPWARAILWTIMALFTAAVIWAVVGQVNVVAIAQGSLVPSGNTKPVQPTHLGRVSQLHVDEGDRVEAGEPLVTLDGTETRAEVQRLQEAVTFRRNKVNRLVSWIQYLNAKLASIRQGNDTHKIPPITQDSLLASRLDALLTRDASLRARIDATETGISQAQARVEQLQRTLPIEREQASAMKVLRAKDMVAKVEYLERQRAVYEMEGELESQRLLKRQRRSELAELRHQRRQIWSDALEKAETRREELTAEIQDLEQELVKARAQNQQQVLKAPVAGIVHNLKINTVGGVVRPAKPVMEIIPRGEPMIAEAWVLNRDIGFVQEGQEASLKIQSFKFTRYGTLPGRVVQISNDAVVEEGNQEAGARYRARIELDREYMNVGDKKLKLSPGMQVTAEITTGHRRLIEFFAAPIMRALHETARER